MLLSDVMLIEKLVVEYNKNCDDLVCDWEDVLLFMVVCKGGSFIEVDVINICNCKGVDVFLIEGVGGKLLFEDMQIVQFGILNLLSYLIDLVWVDIE